MARRILRALSFVMLVVAVAAGAYWGSAVLGVSQLEAGLRERDVVGCRNTWTGRSTLDPLRTFAAAISARAERTATVASPSKMRADHAGGIDHRQPEPD